MWDEDDHFGRWVQLFCAIPLLVIAFALGSYGLMRSSYSYSGYCDGAAFGLLILGIRCLWYAITGKDNVNRDDF